MARFNSAEELIALRPKSNNNKAATRSVREVLSQSDGNIKTYKFKRVKNSTCGWEVDYRDKEE